MNKIYLKTLFLFLSGAFMFSCSEQLAENVPFSTLEDRFKTPPDSIQTSVYWYWISDNISKEGVVKDLHAMKAVGINRAFIGNIGLTGEVPYGDVKLFTDEWWEILHAALKTATELNIEIGLFNSPGWSQSGGPWVKPEQAMRYLAAAETVLEGPRKVLQKLSRPGGAFQDVRVLAFPAPEGYGSTFSSLNPRLNAEPGIAGVDKVMDGDTATVLSLQPGKQTIITMTASSVYTARSLTIYPAKRNMTLNVLLEVKENGNYREVKKVTVDRSNNALNVGFVPYAPVAISFAPATGSAFRLTIDKASPGAGIAEIALATTPKVGRYIEKTLAKMHPTPLPYWHEYQWEPQEAVADDAYLVDPSGVIDLTASMSPDGTLNWEVPEGKWVVMRTGMLPTGVKNGPASPEGTGLEIDKMNHEHVIKHFEAFLGEILKRIPAEDRKTWKVAVQDSYEMGGQNWTDGFMKKFKERFGYDPTPYVPVMYGHVIGSQDRSDRFLWDLRRFIADNVAYEYVGGLRDISHKHGLTIWLENYGHWGFPGEFLQYGGQSDEVGGEFWSEGDLGNIENRAASSAAHIYGRNKVSAESFTAAGNTFGRYPAMMKQRGDRFFTEGINNTLLHVYIHQPYEDRKPGVNAWFGNEFNRFNTWYYDMDMFVDYLKRCNFLLQQGKYVADVAYFIGEDAPKMTGIQDPALPKGYSFDYINGEVIRDRLSVKNGKFILPDGMQYSVLVLPQLKTMRPELLEKIAELVKAGGIVLGPKPERSPSLANYGEADGRVKKLAADLWGAIDGKTVKINTYGKGRVMDGMSLEEVFNETGIRPDVKTTAEDPVLYIHRTLPEGEIYFLSNQSDREISIDPVFRVQGKTPELWNAIHGTVRDLPEFKSMENGTAVPLKLDAYESAFVIFRKEPAPGTTGERLNFPEPLKALEINNTWQVQFDPGSRGPAEPVAFDTLTDWSKHPDPAIAHYSGTAVYHNSFQLDRPEGRVVLDLGAVVALAKVKVNGKEVGGVWTPPYKVDITEAVQEGENKVEIKVVNTWVNRLIGDLKKPEEQRKTWTYINPYAAESPLHPAGLLGPVRVELTAY
ncbi:glycosyl hydrolase family 2 [Anseongella ginsenosidimutans]|uniref:Glycosyl hydrolase family 2 n=1 Tax=Anseongella ginsenosidimutans TaxID=496056 RepID=A0A4R3KRX8_9SPHI|nr:glycosyl hydrolase [Anseongella ginsenosidimutans]QEC53093.1 glycoside hydrolase family 2 [Anseongella ginsenosidimutans]TCS87710.1 glycosyl hydrolase family 2 [Anseongella ginsenosidimutans]